MPSTEPGAGHAAKLLMDWLDRCMISLFSDHIKADGAGFGALGTDAVTNRLLGILRHQALKLALGLLML
jgi:hypothetical protein